MRADCIKLDVSKDVLLSNANVRTRFLEKTSPIQRVRNAKIVFEEPVDDSSVAAKPMSFSWNDLDQLPGGELLSGPGGEQEREYVQVPNSYETVQSSVLSEKVPEERTYRNLRGNPRFMYANVRDPPMLKSYFANYFESPRAYSAKITVGNALKTSDAAEWIAAMKTEMDQMLETGTLEPTEMSKVLPNSSIINSTMVLVQKPEKKKARLCACGNELRGKIADLYSPTIGALTYSTVHQISVIDRMRVRIIDTVGAYLYQVYPDSSPIVYIRIPAKVMEALKIPSDVVYKIKKYIYGLPDSGRAYYLAYAKLLQDACYKKAKSDPSRSLCIDGTWSTDNLGCSLSAWSLSAWSAANLECSQPGVQPGYLSTCLPDSLSTCLSDSLSGYGVAGIWGPRKRLSTFRVPSSRERFGGKDILRAFIACLSLLLHLARFRSDFLLMVAN